MNEEWNLRSNLISDYLIVQISRNTPIPVFTFNWFLYMLSLSISPHLFIFVSFSISLMFFFVERWLLCSSISILHLQSAKCVIITMMPIANYLFALCFVAWCSMIPFCVAFFNHFMFKFIHVYFLYAVGTIFCSVF